jgi:hypothetical protein
MPQPPIQADLGMLAYSAESLAALRSLPQNYQGDCSYRLSRSCTARSHLELDSDDIVNILEPYVDLSVRLVRDVVTFECIVLGWLRHCCNCSL